MTTCPDRHFLPLGGRRRRNTGGLGWHSGCEVCVTLFPKAPAMSISSIASLASQATQAASKAMHHHHAKPSDAAATGGGGILDQITAQLKSATSTPGGTSAAAAGKAQGVSGSLSQVGGSLLSTLSGLLGGSGMSGTSAQAASAYAASSGLGR